MPCPTARSAVPMAAVVLPFPGPVFTMIRPRRMSCVITLGSAALSETNDCKRWGEVLLNVVGYQQLWVMLEAPDCVREFRRGRSGAAPGSGAVKPGPNLLVGCLGKLNE